MRIETKKLTLWIFVLLIVGFGAFYAIEYQNKPVVIKNFDDCVRAGKMVIDSVPRRCEISNGQFIVDIAGITKGDTGEKGRCNSYVFSSYPAREVEKIKTSVDYNSYEDAKKYKTAIDAAFSLGPNFSGHYVVASWGCGATCQESTIIDADTGKILVFGIVSEYGIETKADSKLLVVNPKKNIPEALSAEEQKTLITSFYTLDNDALVLLCRENASIK